ncbi:hypothetical protein GE09DRAFT_1236384 [Coniochaeta sp. 2T2.1]|nr:hypothetical protein GE09DRAFT_1236384 [Coniochaeta sp. 2T2.1]
MPRQKSMVRGPRYGGIWTRIYVLLSPSNYTYIRELAPILDVTPSYTAQDPDNDILVVHLQGHSSAHPPPNLNLLPPLALYLNWSITRQLSRFRATYPQWVAAYAPTFTKSYPILLGLEHRFFLPASSSLAPSSASNAPTQIQAHPSPPPRGLVILLHGWGAGGFFCSPSMDDEQATLLSKRGYLVVSVAYRLAPRHQYPTQIEDIEAIIHCVLSDTASLPISSPPHP